MPLLAYCMMEETATVLKPPATGVGGAKVEELRDSGLCCFFSRFDNEEQIAGIPAVESALAFHQVVQALFQQAALVPFRFPTVLESEAQLKSYLVEHGPQYGEALARLRHMVQMEVRIGEGQEPESAAKSASGREYLLRQQARARALGAAAARYHQSTQEWIVDWHEYRERGGIRCFALLPREAVADFQRAARALREAVPGARISGPWPATEFLQPIKDS